MISHARLKFIDFDARRDPKTDRWCIQCQKELGTGQAIRLVRCLQFGGAPYAVHPDDASKLDAGELDIPPNMRETLDRDLGFCLIGRDCARQLGLEWTTPA